MHQEPVAALPPSPSTEQVEIQGTERGWGCADERGPQEGH